MHFWQRKGKTKIIREIYVNKRLLNWRIREDEKDRNLLDLSSGVNE